MTETFFVYTKHNGVIAVNAHHVCSDAEFVTFVDVSDNLIATFNTNEVFAVFTVLLNVKGYEECADFEGDGVI